MLLTVINNPNIFNKDYFEADRNISYYSLIIGLLREMSKNCIIFTDEEQNILIKSKEYISAWPNEYKKPLTELLKFLAKQGRVVPFYCTKVLGSTKCEEFNCESFHQLVNSNPDTILVVEKCVPCLNDVVGEVVDVQKYQISNFARKVNRNSLVISNNDRTPEELGKQVFEPIFRYCNSIKIIDRFIGGHISPHPGELNSNYKNGLEYLIKCISSSGNSNLKSLVIELYTTIKINGRVSSLGQQEKDDLKETINNIEEYIKSIGVKYNLKIDCHFKMSSSSFRHDRYIITNQIGIYIGRGFDLFDNERNVRDNTFGLIEHGNSISSDVRMLRDIRDVIN